MRLPLVKLGALLFPGCDTMDDVEAAVRTEEHATATNIWNCVRRLLSEVGNGDDDVMLLYVHPDKVIRWLNSDKAPPAAASKLAFYTCLASLSNPDKYRSIARHVPDEVRRRYARRAAELGKIVREEQRSNRLDKRERQAMLPWPEIQAAYRAKRDLLSDERAVIAALYLAGGDVPAGAPRRLDYNAIRVYTGDVPKSGALEPNYIVVRSPTDIHLVLNEFKTSKYYGAYETRLPRSVCRVLHTSVAARPRDWLVHDAKGAPLTPSCFGRRVSSTMKELTGRAIGASNLRKSFITWLYSRNDMSPDRLEQYAKAMNHSPSEQKLYRRKNIMSGVIRKSPV